MGISSAWNSRLLESRTHGLWNFGSLGLWGVGNYTALGLLDFQIFGLLKFGMFGRWDCGTLWDSDFLDFPTSEFGILRQPCGFWGFGPFERLELSTLRIVDSWTLELWNLGFSIWTLGLLGFES